MRRLVCLALSLACTNYAAAQSYRPDFDPGAFKGPLAGPPNEVMVLGTAHLRYLKFDPAFAQPLVHRLARWQPQAIAVEALSGVQCEFMRHYPARYRDSLPIYCWDPAPAKKTTGLDVPAATEQWEQLLAAWPAAPTPAQRRHLAAVFLAGGERPSALIQWLRLAPAERHAGDGLDDTLAAFLQTLAQRGDETALVSAPLAVRLGLERLYAMDDHTADSIGPDDKASGVAIMKAWDIPANAERKRVDQALAAQLTSPAGLLKLYQVYNATGQGKMVFDTDFGPNLNEPSPKRYGRGYVAYWETRNLRMASNIRDTLGMQPGMRMLVIVGASHKGYLEAYLNQMHDVRLADTGAVLK